MKVDFKNLVYQEFLQNLIIKYSLEWEAYLEIVEITCVGTNDEDDQDLI